MKGQGTGTGVGCESLSTTDHRSKTCVREEGRKDSAGTASDFRSSEKLSARPLRSP